MGKPITAVGIVLTVLFVGAGVYVTYKHSDLLSVGMMIAVVGGVVGSFCIVTGIVNWKA